jgi:hypothetical protein
VRAGRPAAANLDQSRSRLVPKRVQALVETGEVVLFADKLRPPHLAGVRRHAALSLAAQIENSQAYDVGPGILQDGRTVC